MTQHLSFNKTGLIKHLPALIFYLFSLLFWWCTKDSPASLKPVSSTSWLLCNSYCSNSVAIEDMMEISTDFLLQEKERELRKVTQNDLLPNISAHYWQM